MEVMIVVEEIKAALEAGDAAWWLIVVGIALRTVRDIVLTLLTPKKDRGRVVEARFSPRSPRSER
ncbi:hypothetical protein H5397_17230 [Propioniciclava sp. MC1683]|uniref:hypothetical protein n=1 Tax=Propioniciclava sp. MC1683 TaxID=2760309 RepID=UPI001601F304|nr:hypothetical protein [Propioniciclava sp. MC1683]MBB1503129.1 hypothetical protein [Propioniciclava sp. MC1683]